MVDPRFKDSQQQSEHREMCGWDAEWCWPRRNKTRTSKEDTHHVVKVWAMSLGDLWTGTDQSLLFVCCSGLQMQGHYIIEIEYLATPAPGLLFKVLTLCRRRDQEPVTKQNHEYVHIKPGGYISKHVFLSISGISCGQRSLQKQPWNANVDVNCFHTRLAFYNLDGFM